MIISDKRATLNYEELGSLTTFVWVTAPILYIVPNSDGSVTIPKETVLELILCHEGVVKQGIKVVKVRNNVSSH